MTDQEARYDRIAEGYAAWWSPIHRAATLALLDEVEPDVAAGATAPPRRRLRHGRAGGGGGRVAGRGVRVTGVDASAGHARRSPTASSTALPPAERDRIDLVQAPADRLPFDDGSFDLALTAFVLQLVPSRHRAAARGAARARAGRDDRRR